MISGKLFHQPQHGMESAPRLAPRLGQGPEPGHVDMGMAAGDNRHIERRAGFGNALAQAL